MKGRFAARTIAASASASASVVASGLSQITAMPCSRKVLQIAKWLSFGVTTLTTSMPSSRDASADAIAAKSS